MWKYQEGIESEEMVWVVCVGFCGVFYFIFKLLGKSIIRDSVFWDSLIFRKAHVDANGFSFYIWRQSHLRRKLRPFHLLKQVNPVFPQSHLWLQNMKALEKRLLKAGQRWRCSLQTFVLSSPWVTSIGKFCFVSSHLDWSMEKHGLYPLPTPNAHVLAGCCRHWSNCSKQY